MSGPLNGNTVPFLVWIVSGLVAALCALIGFVVKMHMKSDEEHRSRIDNEILALRDKMHEVRGMVSGLQALSDLKRMKGE